MSILEIQNLHKSFGELHAIFDVNLKVDHGVLTSIIGPNGAGKTTLFNLISGRLIPDQGIIRVNGKDIVGLPPRKIVRQGISRSFQITNIFPELTVLDNIRIGLTAHFRKSFNSCNSIWWLWKN